MATLPYQFSPVNALKQVGDSINPFNGSTDYDVFGDGTVRGGDRSPADGEYLGRVAGQTDGGIPLGSMRYDETLGQVLEWNGTAWVAAGGVVEGSRADTNSTNNTSPPPTGGSGTAEQFEDTSAQRRAAQTSLDSLGALRDTRLGRENTQYNQLMSRYGDEFSNEQSRFNEETTSNENSYTSQKQAAMLAAAQGGRGLRSTLSAMGALSGTGGVLADRAVMDSANQDLGGARDNFKTNAKTLQTAWGDFEREDKRRKEDALNLRNQNKEAVNADVMSQRQKLLQDMAGYWEEAGNNSQYTNYMDQATALTPQMARMNRSVSQYTPTKAGFNPAELGNYLSGNRDMTVSRQQGSSGNSPALNNPIYANPQKKDKELV